MVDITAIAGAILMPVIRSAGGWLNKSLQDGKITNFELKELAKTSIKTLIYGTLLYFGASGFGVELEPIAAGASAIILDMILTAWKENRNITKR